MALIMPSIDNQCENNNISLIFLFCVKVWVVDFDGLPDAPGVYLFKDSRGTVLYVGKAVSIRRRVASHFKGGGLKQRKLLASTARVDFVVTQSEVAALVLEADLVREHQPYFNVRLKDDKRYPYLRVGWGEDFPGVSIVRRPAGDGARYIGPMPRPGELRRLLRVSTRIFGVRRCKKKITRQDGSPCLNYHIHQCSAPCAGYIDPDSYRRNVRELVRFLEGGHRQTIESLEARMWELAGQQEYEEAARIRDRIRALEAILEPLPLGGDQDVIGLACQGGEALAVVFQVRGGRIAFRDEMALQAGDAPMEEVLEVFLEQYYRYRQEQVPPLILVPCLPPGREVVERWLASRRGGRVEIRLPRRGKKLELLEMAARNAELKLKLEKKPVDTESEPSVDVAGLLVSLKAKLSLPRVPRVIEAFDISNIQGQMATGSLVVFRDGAPSKKEYRRFKIKTPGADDYAQMQELLYRRYSKQPPPPDLILIDGGAGHLAAAERVLSKLEISSPLLALAKEREEIHMRGLNLRLPPESPESMLLQRIRDEAHRFALAYHRDLRRKKETASTLEEIPGIGKTRRKALIQKFGSLKNLEKASIAEIAETPGINQKLAEKIKEHLILR